MFLKSLNRLRKTTGFRLAIWYAALCILHALGLSALMYMVLASSLQQRDRHQIAWKSTRW